MRLTERKTNYPSCDKKGNLEKVEYIEIKDKKLAEEKLCQLEDIEEELGIDLITYFKIKVGVKVYSNLLLGDDLVIDNVFGNDKRALYHIVPRNLRSGVYVGLNEYGRTWALTKEELENE